MGKYSAAPFFCHEKWLPLFLTLRAGRFFVHVKWLPLFLTFLAGVFVPYLDNFVPYFDKILYITYRGGRFLRVLQNFFFILSPEAKKG